MRKVMLFLLLILTSLAFTAMGTAEATTTLLVYMCGTDLQEAGCIDLYEMARAETGDLIHIEVLAGGASAWSDEDLAGNTRNLITIAGGGFTEVTDVGQGSMGDPDSLLSFLEYGLTEFPADRTIVILWDHGAGSAGGICFDETFDDDGLTLTEIQQALNRLWDDLPDTHIDIFGCDACMMASYEMASLMSEYSIDFYVASEELEPENGWAYTSWLTALDREPDMSNEELCAWIIDSFIEESFAEDPDETLTLSAIRLDSMPALISQMESFAGAMADSLQDGQLGTIRRGRSRIYTFGSYCDGSWDMVDLQAVLNAYAGLAPENAQEAEILLEKAVLISGQTENMTPCSGLSILIPQDICKDFEEYEQGFSLISVVPQWVNFVESYVNLINGSSYSFGTVVPDQIISGETITGSPSGNAADEYEIQDSEYGFYIQLSELDLENLDYVEGMLLMDISDEEMFGYIDLGLTRKNWIDWQSGMIYSLFDGSWPVLDGQPVVLYDQSATEHSRRSLIPILLNGENTYLVVIFPTDGTEGRILGTNAGYDANGLPIRETTRLRDGDRIEPVYTMYYQAWEADDDTDLEEMDFTGDVIIWRDGMRVSYSSLESEEDDDPTRLYFGFVLNDLFGDEQLSELVEFEL